MTTNTRLVLDSCVTVNCTFLKKILTPKDAETFNLLMSVWIARESGGPSFWSKSKMIWYKKVIKKVQKWEKSGQIKDKFCDEDATRLKATGSKDMMIHYLFRNASDLQEGTCGVDQRRCVTEVCSTNRNRLVAGGFHSVIVKKVELLFLQLWITAATGWFYLYSVFEINPQF